LTTAGQRILQPNAQPLSRPAFHIVQVGEFTQWPEILAWVSDAAAFHFPFSHPLAGLQARETKLYSRANARKRGWKRTKPPSCSAVAGCTSDRRKSAERTGTRVPAALDLLTVLATKCGNEAAD